MEASSETTVLQAGNLNNEIALVPAQVPYFLVCINFFEGAAPHWPLVPEGICPFEKGQRKRGDRHRTSALEPHAHWIFDSTHRVRAVSHLNEGERSGGNAPFSRADSALQSPSEKIRSPSRSPSASICRKGNVYCSEKLHSGE